MVKRNYERNKEGKKKKKKVHSHSKQADLKKKKIGSKNNAKSVKTGSTQKINVKPATKKH